MKTWKVRTIGETEGTKRCGKCGEAKLLKEFSINKLGRKGRHSKCKVCKGADCKNWRGSNVGYNTWYEKKRNKLDPAFKLRGVLRRRVRKALKGEKTRGTTISNLGCSGPELRIYLESQFQKGMSWDNHGEWHIDHIIPLSAFDLTNKLEMEVACHYLNLQPLWAKENHAKHNSLDDAELIDKIIRAIAVKKGTYYEET